MPQKTRRDELCFVVVSTGVIWGGTLFDHEEKQEARIKRVAHG